VAFRSKKSRTAFHVKTVRTASRILPVLALILSFSSQLNNRKFSKNKRKAYNNINININIQSKNKVKT